MTLIADSLVTAPLSHSELILDQAIDRRSDISAKQAKVAGLLEEVGCEGLLLLDSENFAWFSSGGTSRGVLDPGEHPALFVTPEQRWLLCSNVDTQRLFDEELDELGFQLKEWPWNWGREQLLNDLLQGRKVACDNNIGECRHVSNELRALRRPLSLYEQACLRALGQIVSHALEATCRTMSPHQTEREIAAQISHRLIHRGVFPGSIGVAADGRSSVYRQFGFTATPVDQYAVLWAVGKKYGLHAMASRTVSFGAAAATLQKAHDTATRVAATYIASSWPDAMPRQVLTSGQRVYRLTGYEHDWLLCPQGHVTGRAAVELPMTMDCTELLQPGWALTWRASAGPAVSADSYLVTDTGPQLVTPTDFWPLKKIRVMGAEFLLPDVLVREAEATSRDTDTPDTPEEEGKE
jgi:Xaa-Pro dipeptidase